MVDAGRRVPRPLPRMRWEPLPGSAVPRQGPVIRALPALLAVLAVALLAGAVLALAGLRLGEPGGDR